MVAALLWQPIHLQACICHARQALSLHTSYESGCAVLPLLVMEPPLELPVLFASAWIVLVLRWRKAVGARHFLKLVALTEFRLVETRRLVRIMLAVCIVIAIGTMCLP